MSDRPDQRPPKDTSSTTTIHTATTSPDTRPASGKLPPEVEDTVLDVIGLLVEYDMDTRGYVWKEDVLSRVLVALAPDDEAMQDGIRQEASKALAKWNEHQATGTVRHQPLP